MLAKLLLAAGIVVMAAAIMYGLAAGDIWNEARTLLPFPWFRVAMIDLYVGFALFASWIAVREQHGPRAAIWIILLLLLGNLVSCAYALWALIQSRGDAQRFWLGHRATTLAQPPLPR